MKKNVMEAFKLFSQLNANGQMLKQEAKHIWMTKSEDF